MSLPQSREGTSFPLDNLLQVEEPTIERSLLAEISDYELHARTGHWSVEEDQRLITLVNDLGPTNWFNVAHFLGTKTPEYCRERWYQNVKPGLNHGPIIMEEAVIIQRGVDLNGPHWANIARKLQGRSENAVENYWNGLSNSEKNQIKRHIVPRRVSTEGSDQHQALEPDTQPLNEPPSPLRHDESVTRHARGERLNQVEPTSAIPSQRPGIMKRAMYSVMPPSGIKPGNGDKFEEPTSTSTPAPHRTLGCLTFGMMSRSGSMSTEIAMQTRDSGFNSTEEVSRPGYRSGFGSSSMHHKQQEQQSYEKSKTNRTMKMLWLGALARKEKNPVLVETPPETRRPSARTLWSRQTTAAKKSRLDRTISEMSRARPTKSSVGQETYPLDDDSRPNSIERALDPSEASNADKSMTGEPESFLHPAPKSRMASFNKVMMLGGTKDKVEPTVKSTSITSSTQTNSDRGAGGVFAGFGVAFPNFRRNNGGQNADANANRQGTPSNLEAGVSQDLKDAEYISASIPQSWNSTQFDNLASETGVESRKYPSTRMGRVMSTLSIPTNPSTQSSGSGSTPGMKSKKNKARESSPDANVEDAEGQEAPDGDGEPSSSNAKGSQASSKHISPPLEPNPDVVQLSAQLAQLTDLVQQLVAEKTRRLSVNSSISVTKCNPKIRRTLSGSGKDIEALYDSDGFSLHNEDEELNDDNNETAVADEPTIMEAKRFLGIPRIRRNSKSR